MYGCIYKIQMFYKNKEKVGLKKRFLSIIT